MSHCVMRYRFIRCQFCNGNGPYVRIHISFFEFISHKNLSLYKVTESVHVLSAEKVTQLFMGKNKLFTENFFASVTNH